MDWEPDIVDKIRDAANTVTQSSALINVREFVAQWKSTLAEQEVSMCTADSLPYNYVCCENSIPKDILEELFIVTNPATTLYPEGLVPYKTVNVASVPSDVKLHTLKHTIKCSKLKRQSIRYYHLSQSSLSYNYNTDEHLAHKHATITAERLQEMKVADPLRKPTRYMLFPEAVFSVSYMKPHKQKVADPKRGAQAVYLNLLGQNTLSELRDAMKCPRDFEIPGDFSNTPDDSKSVERAKDILPSSLFFIEGKFYVDNRSLKFKDYSKIIVEWLRKKGCTEEFPVKSMSKVSLLDMELRLGVPYLFIHQGNCEHIILFTDIRLLNSDDSQIPSAYPIQLSTQTTKLAICTCCQTRANRWMVVNSTLSPSDPAHYCDVCFKMMHYDSQGKKNCDFQAYRFTDNAYVLCTT